MNSVFKWSTLALAAISSWANANESQQCTSLSFQQSDDYVIDIAAVDSKPVDFNRTSQQIMSGTIQYQLTPGEHAITLIQYPKAFFKADRFDGRYGHRTKDFDSLAMRVVYLNVAADHHFQIALSENSATAAFEIIDQQAKNCIVNQDKLLGGNERSLYIDNEPLPEELEQSLLDTMMRIARYHQQSSTTQANVMPIKTDGYFGAVIDDQYTDNGQIKVLSILPFSLAANLGLKSGDIILQLGGESIDQSQSSAREVFSQYLQSRGYRAELDFQVLRNGVNIQVTGENRLPIIPGSHYFIDAMDVKSLEIVNTQAIDSNLAFDYERNILALQRYYQSKGVDADHVQIKREERQSKSLGLKGKALAGKGLLVSAVEDNSPLAKLGVKAGDIIVSGANKQLLTDSVSRFLSEVQHWQAQQTVSLSVKRAEGIVELTGKYLPNHLPAFAITLDMQTEKYLQQAQEKPRNRFVRDSILRVFAERHKFISAPAGLNVDSGDRGLNINQNVNTSGSGNR